MSKEKSIWRLNPITGIWEFQRKCLHGSEDIWLNIFQRDEPEVKFKLSVNRPRYHIKGP